MVLARQYTQRLLFILLLCLAVISGCGATTASSLPAQEPVTVRFAARISVANYATLAEEFHREHPNIIIEIVPVPQGPAGQNLRTLGVDVFRDAVAYPPDLQLKNELLPLDEWINADKAFPRADIFAGVMDATKIDGVQYGIPAGLNPVVAYYDNARFKAVRATPPTANWTVNDFLNAAVSVNHQGARDVNNADFAYGFCTVPLSADPIILTYLLGGQLFDNLQNPTRTTLDAPANQRALQWFASLRQQYAVTPDPDEFKSLFAARGLTEATMRSKCGLWMGAYADVGNRPTGLKWQGEPVMLPLPRGQTPFAVASADGYFILRQSTHRDAAWQWLVFLMDHQEAAGIQMPPRRSLIDSAAFAGRVTADALRVAHSLPDNVILLGGGTPQGAASVFSIYLEAVDQVVRGNADAKSALAAAQTRAGMIFNRQQ